MTCEDEIRAYQFRRDAGSLADWLEHGGTLPEPERARIHALTRKVTMSDESLIPLARKAYHPDGESADVHSALKDLRDQYEERGKYAVTSPATQALSKESQPETSTPTQSTLSDPTTDEKA